MSSFVVFVGDISFFDDEGCHTKNDGIVIEWADGFGQWYE